MTTEGTISGRVFWALAAAFLLNDLAFWALSDRAVIYPADWAIRIGVLVAILVWPTARSAAWKPSGDAGNIAWCIAVAVLLPLLSFPFETLDRAIDALIGFPLLFRYPGLAPGPLYWIDMSLGLFLVAVSEELVFRKLARSWLVGRGATPLQVIVISSVIFGLIHWGGGAGQVMTAAMIGAIYMALYLRLNRIWPLVLAHWGHNFLAFAAF